MKISVIVPVYQAEKYVNRCLDSIDIQSYRDFSLFIADDGSWDCSSTMCDEYAITHENTIICHKLNGGAGAARNNGIEYALLSNSAWIAFVDSDDWIHQQYLELLYGAVTQTKSKISMCDCYDFDMDEIANNHQNHNLNYAMISPEDLWCTSKSSCVVPWEKLISKSLFSKDKRFPEVKFGEDEGLLYKLLFQEKEIALVNAKIYFRYKSPDSMMRSEWSKKRMDALPFLRQQIAYFYKNKMRKAMITSICDYMFWLSSNYDKLSESDKVTKKKILKDMFKLANSCFWSYRLNIKKYFWIYSSPISKLLNKNKGK